MENSTPTYPRAPNARALKVLSLLYIPILVIFVLEVTGATDLFTTAVTNAWFTLFTLLLMVLGILHKDALSDTKSPATQYMRDEIIRLAGSSPDAKAAVRDVLRRGDQFTKWDYSFERTRIAEIAAKHTERTFMAETE